MYFLLAVFIAFTSSSTLLKTSAAAAAQDTNVLSDDDFVPNSGDQDRFDWTLIKHIASSFDRNFLLSPLSLKLTLSLLQEAATGATQAEYSAVLREDLNRTENRKKYQYITELLRKNTPDDIVYLKSWIFITANAKKQQQFEAIGQTFYNTDITNVNVLSAIEAAKEINSEVLNATLGNIINPVSVDDVADMRMLVFNTLYFAGVWRHQFPLTATRTAEFYVSPTTLKVVPLMKVVNEFYYAESTKFDAKILRMPYKGNTFAMYFIVPNSLTGLSYVLENIRLLPTELQLLQKHVVDVNLPKFKFAYTIYLEKTLKEMGLNIAFERMASYPGVVRGQLLANPLQLSKVMQGTVINVNERGAGTSPVTEVTNEIQEVMANRPFFFFIKDEVTNHLLVFGKVADPTLDAGT